MRLTAGSVAAVLMVAASLADTGYYARGLLVERMLSGPALQQVVRLSPSLLPKGASQEVVGRPLGPGDRGLLRAAIWREPLDQRFINTLYVDAVTSDAPAAVIERDARLLAALGWRHTPAQQNLLLRDALAGSYRAVLDRGDALLRRQKLLAVANSMVAALEITEDGRRLLIDRLRQQPAWRSDYLVATSQAAPPSFLLARARTLTALITARSPIQRREIAPVLSGLLASGYRREALTLWVRYNGPQRRRTGNLLVDPTFDRLRSLGNTAGPSLPFEWQLSSEPGADVAVSSNAPGLGIDWNGKGVPGFASQWVEAQTGRAYRFVVLGQANATTLSELIRPVFVCGERQIVFDKIAAGPNAAAYRSDRVPDGCDVMQLDIGAQLRDDVKPVSATLTRVELTPF